MTIPRAQPETWTPFSTRGLKSASPRNDKSPGLPARSSDREKVRAPRYAAVYALSCLTPYLGLRSADGPTA